MNRGLESEPVNLGFERIVNHLTLLARTSHVFILTPRQRHQCAENKRVWNDWFKVIKKIWMI